MRKRPRLDTNQAEIVAAFERLGCSVQSLAALGDGVPDLLVATRGETCLIEVKSKLGGLTEDQEHWLARWRGEWWLVRSADDVIEAVALLRSKALKFGETRPRGPAALDEGESMKKKGKGKGGGKRPC